MEERIKNMQMGPKIGGNKKRGIPLSPFLAVKPAMPAIGLRLPRRKIERGGQLYMMFAQTGMT